MKIGKFILPTLMIVIFAVVMINLDNISNGITDYLRADPKLVIMPSNEYTKKDSFLFVQPSENYIPYSYQDLINIVYSTINNGWNTFTFYCPSEYTDCINDVKTLSGDNSLLTHLNNYTHPFNNFSNIKTIFDESGEVTLKINKLYSNTMIKDINQEVDRIIKEKITSDMTDEDKVMAIHDYIINNTQYDVVKNQTGDSEYASNIAYGALLQHYAICGGYADAMAIFLTRFGLPNYKIASATHVWNAVYINGKWLHLDLTWDDPVSEKGVNYLYHKYFLIDNKGLKDADGSFENHLFDSSIYLEFK